MRHTEMRFSSFEYHNGLKQPRTRCSVRRELLEAAYAESFPE
jgi:hypothetical protein